MHGLVGLFAAWIVLGIGMGSGLYEAAFATLVRLHGRRSRDYITGITLIAGFASTIGWPVTTLLDAQFGWRGACWTWAALHLLLGLPLNLLIPKIDASPPPLEAGGATPIAPADEAPTSPLPHARRAAMLLSMVFATTYFVATAMAAHLPRLLQATGATLATAVAAGALVGPAQVVARLLEYGVLQRWHPLLSARLATLMHPVGAVILLLVGAPAVVAFALLHGAGNGILTITRGTLPLVLFGSKGYGERQGLLMIPARIGQAISPWVFGLCIDWWGAGALVLSASLWGAAFVALMFLPRSSAGPSQTRNAPTAA
jgi:predicted MFS family arabinose efflux permease